MLVAVEAKDLDGDPLTYSVATQPAHGTLSGAAPDLTYTPDPDYNGPDSFTFTANDGTVDSNLATVRITVDPTAGQRNDQAGQGGTPFFRPADPRLAPRPV